MGNSRLTREIRRKETIATLRAIADDLEKGCDGFDWLVGFDFTGGYQVELKTEIARLKKEFINADESKLKALEGLIEQAAYERLYLKQLNVQALSTGLVEFHPENAKLQRNLPVSAEIARHSAALTNIMDKLMKHLSTGDSEEEDGLGEYE